MTKFRKLGKRGLALFVALVLLVGMVPLGASAENDTAPGTVEKSSIAHDFQQFPWSNDFSYDGFNYYCQTTKGSVTIDTEAGVYDEGIPNINPRGGWVTPNANSYYNPVVTGTNDVVNVQVSWEGKKLRVNFTPGSKTGKATVKVQITFTYTTIGAYSGTTADGNLYFWYDVTNTVGSNPEPSYPDYPDANNLQDIYVYTECDKQPCYKVEAKLSDSRNVDGWECSNIRKNTGELGTSNLLERYPYACTLTLKNEHWVKVFNDTLKANNIKKPTHYLSDRTKTVSMTLLYNAEKGWWDYDEEALYVYVTERVPATTTYKVVREYFYNGEKAATVTDKEQTANVGDKITGATLAKENPAWNTHTIDREKVEFTYAGSDPATLTLSTTAALNVITLRYEKNADPDPEYTYTLTYDANAGTDTVEGMPATESHTSAETSHTFTLSTETPTRTGWVFKGWSTTNNGPAGETSVTATSEEPNVTVYAIWEESTPIDPDPETATITLIYDANGGTGSMDADSQEVAMGASATFTVKENAFTHQGYTFTGWNTEADGSGETVAADSIFTTAVDATLYAQWESTDPDPTDPGPGPVDPPTPPTPIVTPEPVATPTPSAEPTAGPTDDPGVDIPDPTQPPLGPGPSDDPGTDIPDEEPPMGDNPILNLVDHYHYLVGYPDGSIRPGANITRAEVAEVFYRLMTADGRVANWATGNSYSDVIDTAWYTDAINVMSKAGIVNGYEDGTARPNRAITRAEFAMIASQFLADYVEDPGTTTFTDIQGHWAESAIRKVQSIGWVNGDAGTTNFRPNDKITRAEAAVIFNNMLERTPDAEHLDGAMKVWPDNEPGAWYYAAMQEATNSHYYTGNEETESEEWAEVFEHDWVALKAYWKANAGQSPEE